MKIVRSTLTILSLVALTAAACRTAPDLAARRAEILQLHATAIAAHNQKDVGFFTRDLADDYFSVSRGRIDHPTREEIRTRFENYLSSTTFTEYRDLEKPIIGVSRDGSMAWSVVRVKVAGRRAMADGAVQDLDFVCAWITLYKRQDDRWLRLGDVSTFE
jgi:hypothetical protein